MGLFDYIVCEYKLPMTESLLELSKDKLQNETYQTKDLICCMSTYKIKEDGYLWIVKNEYEYKKGNPNSDSIFGQMGQMNVVKSWEEKTEHTGEVNFYSSFIENEYENDYFVEYKALFFKGKLVELNLIKFEVKSNKERIERWNKIQKDWKAAEDFINKWYIKLWYAPWRFFVKKSFSFYRGCLKKLPSNYKLERLLTPW